MSPPALAGGGELIEELLLDKLWKGGIVLAGLAVLALAMWLIWRRYGTPGR